MICRRIADVAFAAVLSIFLSPSLAYSQGAKVPASGRKQSTLLIMVDGLPWDAVNPMATPNIDKIAKRGVGTPTLPAWPTISSPNHWALFTGLYPVHSGLFSNDMYDPKTRTFLDPVGGGPFWGKGSPIWASVAASGRISGMIGELAGWRTPEPGKKPTWQMAYVVGEGQRDNRAELVLGTLDQDAGTRPDLLTLSFVEVDHDLHAHGVGSTEANRTITHVDSVIGKIADGLRDRHLEGQVNIVIVSDHGMANVGKNQVIYLEELIDLSELSVRPSGGGPIWALWPKSGKADSTYKKLKRNTSHIRLYRPGEIPTEMHCCDPAITPPIMIVADTGWTIMARKGPGVQRGMHGYDNNLAEMRGTFVAAGPAIRHAAKVDAFETVDVYPLLAGLLNIAPEKNDGSLKALCSIALPVTRQCGR